MARRRDPEGDDAHYLALRRSGLSYREIAKKCGVSYRTVWRGVAEARERERYSPPPLPGEPNLVPSFGSSNKPFRLLVCSDVHPGGAIPKGSRLYCPCEGCHKSGMDHHPALKRSPKTDPKPDPKPKPPVERKTKAKKKQRA